MAPSSAAAPSIKLRAAAVHAAPVFMDKKATAAKVVRIIEDAGRDAVKLLAFPETFIPGYPYFSEAYAPLQQVGALARYAEESVVCDESDECIRSIQAACRSAGVAVSLGVSERMPGGYSLFNSQVVIDEDGAILGVHRKIQPTYCERFVWAQGSGWSLRTWRPKLGYNLGGLCCWENTFNGARQALIHQNEHVHVGAWPALSTMQGFEPVADAQIEALMKTHALTAQVFVLTAANYIDDACLEWMEKNIGKQDFIKAGGGWSAVIHPFCSFLAGPHTGSEERLVTAELDFADLGPVKVWIDGNGHYKRPEIIDFRFDTRPLWANEGVVPRFPESQVQGPAEPKDEGDQRT
ncbi:putative aliphatic nitrilase protein [Neofusicoccum parvum UCRNP2]|uniref:Putative aliphatic nitrilase protein n=1 Tax=Botryosphaeria parva (strain UCR-NP2) TaxID=1287680 RepID=R1EG19_BOTPV|nr:putative aliphatic nitrilase protein [Neofusicoccum parvum UCRNP2]